MKKRLLSALLALALVFVLLPTTALAKVVTSNEDISIAGIGWKFESDSEVGYFYNGNFTTDEPNGSYLKLTKSSDTITVTVYGNVTVSNIKVHKDFVDIGEKINLIIAGNNKRSTLTLNCTGTHGAALETYQSGDITIKDGITVNANFSADNTDKFTDCYGIRASKNLIITGKGTTVNAVNADDVAAVKVDGNITVSDGAQLKATNKYSKKVTNYTGNAYAIECGGQLSISGDKTKVTAKTSNGKQAISGTVSNGDKLTFKVQLYLASSTLDQKPMDKALGYKYVEITQAPTDPYVFIAGEPAIMGQETPIPGGSGTYLYVDAGYDGNILTLKDATINKTDSIKAVQAIRFGKNGYYTINLVGTNTISGFSSGIVAPNDPGVNNVTVVLSGSGSLDISAKQYAIDMQVGKLKFENTGKIMLTTSYVFTYPLNALRVKTGSITIDNTKYDIVGARQEENYPTEVISDSSVFDPAYLNGYTVGGETTLFKTITITPAAAKDSTISYGGTTLKQGETIKDGKGGTATVDSKNNTITLDNFKGNYPLEFNAEFTPNSVTLIGDSTLSAVETKYQNLTISGSGSLTVGSIRVPNNTQNTANLTITGGAHVTVNRPSGEDEPAVEVSGNLTVTGDGTQLSAECTAATNPAIEVGGNVTISGDPGTNAYTVKAYNKYDTPRDRVEGLRPSQMPSAIEISGDSLSISNSARVMAKTKSDGAAVWMPALKVISVVDASLIAQNSSHNFSTISFGDESNMGNIYAKGQVNIVAENMLGSNSRLAHKAIKAYIYNHYSTGDSNPYYIKVVSEGVHSGGNVNVNVIPGDCTSTGGYKVAITRGDAYSAPTTISKIIITGLTPPVKGETPVTTGVSLGTGLTVTEVTWGGTFTSDGKFKADESYTAHIKYTVDAGYMLATDAQCQDISAADVVILNKSKSQVEVTFHTAADTTHQHTSETGWETDGTNHWKTCSTCSQRYNEGACTISGYNNDNGASGYHKVLCSVGHVMKTESHDYEYKITQDGTMHYKECKTCHYTTHPVSHNFGSSGTESCECGAIPSHTHNLSGQKGNDETNHWDICSECSQHVNEAPHTYGAWITDTPATDTTDGSKHRTCSVCQYQENATIPKTGTGEIVPPTPDNPGTIVIIRPAEEEKPAQQPNPSTGANDLVGLAVAAAVAAALGSAALLRKHD